MSAHVRVQPWRRAIARHKLVDHLRRRGFTDHVDIDDHSETLAAPVAAEEGSALDARQMLSSLPEPEPQLADSVSDALGRSEDAFATFMELLRGAVAQAVRDTARGRPDPDQAALIGARPLDAWVDIWQALGRVQDETEGLFLDKRQAVAHSIALLAASP